MELKILILKSLIAKLVTVVRHIMLDNFFTIIMQRTAMARLPRQQRPAAANCQEMPDCHAVQGRQEHSTNPAP